MEKPFVEVLKEYRKKKKLTQQQLADKLNIERQTISNWERGKSFPNISLVNDLSLVLNLDKNYIYDLISNGDAKIDENRLKKYRKRIFWKYFIISLLFLFLFIIVIIFLIFRNKFEVYKIYFKDNSNFNIKNALLVKSSSGNYFQFGNIINNTDEQIYKIELYVKDNENIIIYETTYDSGDEIYFQESYGYSEYFNKSKNELDNLYLLITTIVDDKFVEYDLKIETNLILKNNLLFHYKKDEIGDDNPNNSYNPDEENEKYIKLFRNNGYKYVEGNLVKQIKNETFEYSYLKLFYSKESDGCLSVYFLDSNFIDVSCYKNGIGGNSTYNILDESFSCINGNCDGYMLYVDKLLNEYKRIQSNK